MRARAPGGSRESGGGDAATAFLFGGDDQAIAKIIGRASSTEEVLDTWRTPEMAFPRQWEERFGAEVMLPILGDTLKRAVQSAGLKPDQISKVLVDSTNPRVNREFLGAAKVKPEQAGDDFSATLGRAGAAHIGLMLAKALDGHMDVDELERGDRVRIVAQEVTVLGDFARYAGIEALEVLPRDPKAKPLRIYYFHHARVGGYYSGRGQAPYEGGWRKPIKDAPRTSPWNPHRINPVLKKVMPHQGTDFGSPTGTPIGASSFGTVSFLGPAGPAGNLVKVMHPGGIETGYAHMSRFAAGLKVGDKVKRMQLLGYVGSTGRSTGPHLHFSAKRNGKFFDPLELKLDALELLPVEERATFLQQKQLLDRALEAIPLPEPPPEEPSAPEPPPDEDQASEERAEEEADEAPEIAFPDAHIKAFDPCARPFAAFAFVLEKSELTALLQIEVAVNARNLIGRGVNRDEAQDQWQDKPFQATRVVFSAAYFSATPASHCRY